IKAIVEERGLASISDEGELAKLCEQVIKEQDQAVQDYKSGNEKTFNFLVGQVMRLTKGKAAPDVIKKLMKDKLS
ncbi:MAG: Asp-tRNA(Asn)/Glu-tRNA(Gln) amidotransferase GatCAB subunit B, partial [Candidatus Nanoarchaeia archaeon]